MGVLALLVAGSVALHIAASVAAVFAGLSVSLWLMVPLLVAFNIIAAAVFNRLKSWLAGPLRKADDKLAYKICSTGVLGVQRRMMRRLPSSPRCRFCHAPFRGWGPFLGLRPSGKNPNYCVSCMEVLPTRSIEGEIGVLFADLRGFTRWTEQHSPADAAALLTRFYDVANQALTPDDCFVEFVGDQVMAFYWTSMPSLRKRPANVVLGGAHRLVESIRGEVEGLPVGVGLGIGIAELGSFMKGGVRDFTVIGDVVNTTARLQGRAQPYEIVMSEPFYRALDGDVGDAERTVLNLKGKSEPVTAYVLGERR